MTTAHANRIDIYKSVHKTLRFFLFKVSSSIGKYDPLLDSNLSEIKADFEELSAWIKVHGEHEDRLFHTLIEKKHPNIFDSLQRQHDQSETDLRVLEEDAAGIFESSQKTSPADWHRFYLKFNQFIVGYLTHLQYEELVALPLIWEVASDEVLMQAIMEMHKTLTPEDIARSRKWCLMSCNLSELKAMRYVP
jgi:hypothetical protein